MQEQAEVQVQRVLVISEICVEEFAVLVDEDGPAVHGTVGQGHAPDGADLVNDLGRVGGEGEAERFDDVIVEHGRFDGDIAGLAGCLGRPACNLEGEWGWV